MNRRKTFLVLGLALITGTLAGLAALQYLEQIPRRLSASESDEERVRVVMAARDLEVGSRVAREDLQMVEWPATVAPAGFFTSMDDVVGRGLLVPVQANEAIMDRKLASPEAGGGLSIMIPEGMRALSIRVDEVVGVAGFVLPGTRVDVLLTVDDATQAILQNIPALAAGQSIQQDADGEPMKVTVVTLLVSPEQAERLTLASTKGRIQLALRNTMDLEEVETPGFRSASLLELGRGQEPEGPRRRVIRPTTNASQPTVIEVYKGGTKTLVTYN